MDISDLEIRDIQQFLIFCVFVYCSRDSPTKTLKAFFGLSNKHSYEFAFLYYAQLLTEFPTSFIRLHVRRINFAPKGICSHAHTTLEAHALSYCTRIPMCIQRCMHIGGAYALRDKINITRVSGLNNLCKSHVLIACASKIGFGRLVDKSI